MTNCPNCGAVLNKYGCCEYCGTFVISKYMIPTDIIQKIITDNNINKNYEFNPNMVFSETAPIGVSKIDHYNSILSNIYKLLIYSHIYNFDYLIINPSIIPVFILSNLYESTNIRLKDDDKIRFMGKLGNTHLYSTIELPEDVFIAGELKQNNEHREIVGRINTWR